MHVLLNGLFVFILVPGSILGLQGPDHCMTEHMANQQVWFTTCHDNYVNQWPLLHSIPPYCPSWVSHHWMVRAGGPYQLWSRCVFTQALLPEAKDRDMLDRPWLHHTIRNQLLWVSLLLPAGSKQEEANVPGRHSVLLLTTPSLSYPWVSEDLHFSMQTCKSS